jgi:putative MATE family efflux protein
MGASPSIISTGSRYTSIVFGSSWTLMLLFLNNAIFRGAGDAAIAMRVLWLANLINLVLDPCLIFGWGPFPELGVTGAAVATSTGRAVGVLYQFYLLFRGRGRIQIRPRHLRIDVPVMTTLVRVSLTGILQFLIAHASWIGLARLVASFGDAAVAGYTIAIRIIVFAILPSWGLSNAAATLVGQCLGAGKPERAERAVWVTAFWNMIFLGAEGLVFIVFTEPIVRLFTSSPDAARIAVECLRLISFGNIAYSWGMVMTQAFNGAGDTVTPTIVNVFCYWMWELPLAYALALTFGMGPRGVFLSIPIAEATMAAVAIALFRRGGWKKKQI